jgi:hypothetical protein
LLWPEIADFGISAASGWRTGPTAQKVGVESAIGSDEPIPFESIARKRNMRLRNGFGHALVCSVVLMGQAGPVFAQQPPKDTSVTRATAWQLPDDRIGVRTAPILLLSRDDVAADLKLTEEQRQKTWGMIADLGKRAADLKGRNDKDALVLRRQIDQSQLEWLARELTPEQNARLSQIDLQWEGPLSLISRPQVSQAMHLSEEQKAKIRTILVANSDTAANRTADVGRRQNAIRLIFKELDETQQQTWRALVGPDFFAVPRTASAK